MLSLEEQTRQVSNEMILNQQLIQGTMSKIDQIQSKDDTLSELIGYQHTPVIVPALKIPIMSHTEQLQEKIRQLERKVKKNAQESKLEAQKLMSSSTQYHQLYSSEMMQRLEVQEALDDLQELHKKKTQCLHYRYYKLKNKRR